MLYLGLNVKVDESDKDTFHISQIYKDSHLLKIEPLQRK